MTGTPDPPAMDLDEAQRRAHNPDADGPKFEYSLRVLWPDDNGLTLTSGQCGPAGMQRVLRHEADAIEACYPTATPDAPRPDLDEADPLHAMSREAQTRAIAYTVASPNERHVLFGLLLADYDQQAAELDRLRAIEQRAREVAETGCVDGGYSWPARYAARYILGEA